MLNVATSRAMPANTVRNVVSMSRNSSLMSSAFCEDTSVPATASTPSGSTSSMRATSSSCEVPSSARTAMLDTPSGSLVTCSMAPSRVKAVKVTPPRPSPAAPSIWRTPWFGGSAAATPSTPATSSTSDRSIRPRGSSASMPRSVALRTMTSVPALTSANRSSKLARRVSPSTRVPARKATPRNTAKAVPTRRRPWPRISLTVSDNMSVSQLLDAVEHGRRRRVVEVIDDPAVGQELRPVGVRGRHRVVGDHHDGLAHLVDGPAQEAEDLAAGAGVDVARGLVGEHDPGPRRQGTGHGDPLLLTARQLRRPVPQPVAEPDGVDDLVEPGRIGLGAGQRERQDDVLAGGERRHQVVGLEHEADLGAPQESELLVGQRAQLDVADEHLALGEGVEPGDAVHERRLARARGAHDGGEPPGGELHRHLVEGDDGGLARAVDLGGVHGPGGRIGAGKGGGGGHRSSSFRTASRSRYSSAEMSPRA